MRLNSLGTGVIAIFVGGGLLLTFGAVLLAEHVAYGLPAAVILGVIGVGWLAAGLVAIVVAARSAVRNHHKRWLARHGIRGRATIVDAIGEMSVNEQPLFSVVFDADVPGQGTRRVERTIVVGNFAARRMEPGVVMPVYVHPRRPDDLLLVW